MQKSRPKALLLLASLSLLASSVQLHQPDQSQITAASYTPSAILFLLSASPTSMSIFQGYSGWSTIVITTLPGQVGSVSLSAKAPAGLTANLNRTTVSLPPSPATAILSISVTPGTPPGIYPIVVNGTSGGSFHPVAVTVTVLPTAAPDFSILSGPASQTVPAGGNGTTIIDVTSLNSYSGNVKLSAKVSPAGLTTSLTPASVTVPSDGTAYSIMKIMTNTSTPGNYAITLEGSNGTITDLWTLEAFVSTSPPDFDISPSSTSLTIPAGTNNTSQVTVDGFNSFTGDVKLSATISSAGPAVSITPFSTVSSTGSGKSTLNIVTTSSTPPGKYLVKVNGTNGALSHCTSLILTVIPGAPPSFSVSANPASITLQAVAGSSSSITLTSLNEFHGDVALSVTLIIPNTNAPTVSFSPATLALSKNQSATSTLTVTPTPSTASGGYTVLLQASSGAMSDSWTFQVFVSTIGSDFSIAPTPTSLTVVQGESTTAKIFLMSLGGLSGSVRLSVCLSCVPTIVAERPMIVFSSSGPLLGLNAMANSTVTVFTNSTTPIGVYDMVVSASSGAILHFVSILIKVESPADFSLAPSFDNVSFPAGSMGGNNILVTGLNGFAGTISFTSSPNPSIGLGASCTSITLTASTTMDTSTCSFSSSTLGTYLVILTGSAQQPSLSHHAIVFVTVNQPKGSPTITTSLSISTIVAGGSVTDSAVLTGATSTASGKVTYQFFSGSLCTGTATLVGSPVTVTSGNIPVSSSEIFSSPGLFSWDAIYSGDKDNNAATSQCETLTVNPLTSADFKMSVSPHFLTVSEDQQGIAQVTVQGLGFTGRVHLHLTITPRVRHGIHAFLQNETLTLSGGATNQTGLVIIAREDTPPGTYELTITATSGLIHHSVQLIVTVVGESDHITCDGPLGED